MIKPGGLLMVHPRAKCESQTIVDDLTMKMAGALRHASRGASFRGFHICTGCGGAMSGNTELFVMLDGKKVETNSLAVHYLACHRGEISHVELEKVSRLEYDSAVPGPKTIQRPSWKEAYADSKGNSRGLHRNRGSVANVARPQKRGR